MNQRVTGLIPSQDTCLGCGPGPQLEARERQPHIDVSLSVFLPPFPSLNINKFNKMQLDHTIYLHDTNILSISKRVSRYLKIDPSAFPLPPGEGPVCHLSDGLVSQDLLFPPNVFKFEETVLYKH